jgi:hypothetical protein
MRHSRAGLVQRKRAKAEGLPKNISIEDIGQATMEAFNGKN